MDALKCRAFLATAELGSMSAAAESLGYTQSGITRMIRSLEEELGFPLLIREKNGTALTGNGREMLPAIHDIVRAEERAQQTALEINHITRGVLTIGGYFSISALILPRILSVYRSRYPGIVIRLQEGGNREMAKWLTERSVDICFCARPEKDISCDWIEYFQDELVAWIPKSDPDSALRAFPLKRLEKRPLIQTLPNHDTDLDRLLKKNHLHPDIRFTTRDTYTTYNMVAAGLGISFDQRLNAKRWSGDVVEVPFDPPQYISLGIAVPSLKELSPAARKFIDCLDESPHLRSYADNPEADCPDADCPDAGCPDTDCPDADCPDAGCPDQPSAS